MRVQGKSAGAGGSTAAGVWNWLRVGSLAQGSMRRASRWPSPGSVKGMRSWAPICAYRTWVASRDRYATN